MRTQLRSLDQDGNNVENAMSLLKVAEGSVARTVDIMRTMKEKAINAANDTNTDEDRAIIQKEPDMDVEIGEETRTWRSANSQLMGGLIFRIGTKANQNINVKMSNMDAEALGLRDKNRNNIQVTTQKRATAAISWISQ